MDQDREKLVSTIRDVYGRLAWAHKSQEKEREIQAGLATRYKTVNAYLISISTVILIMSLAFGEPIATFLGTILAFISTLFAVYQLSFSPEARSSSHREAAKALLRERERLLLLLTDAMSVNTNIQEIRMRLEDTIQRINEINAIAPDTTSNAYKLAGKALNVDEELTLSHEEIDRLLPAELRLSTKSQKPTVLQQQASVATTKKDVN